MKYFHYGTHLILDEGPIYDLHRLEFKKKYFPALDDLECGVSYITQKKLVTLLWIFLCEYDIFGPNKKHKFNLNQ